jgi:hypothetical protein
VLRIATIALMFVAVNASSAICQIDPDSNGLGVYFDREATVTNRTITGTNERTVAYIALTNESDAITDGVVSLGVAFDWSGGGLLGLSSHGDTYDPYVDPSTRLWDGGTRPSETTALSFVISPGTASIAGVRILGWFEILNSSYPEPGVAIYVRGPAPASGQMAPFFAPADLESVDEIVYLSPSSGGGDLPVATINRERPVRIEASSWDAIKAMFR